MRRGVAAHADRVALLRAAHALGVIDYQGCTPLPGAVYHVACGPVERTLTPAAVLPYLVGVLDARGDPAAILARLLPPDEPTHMM